jgi:hypothetical protein
VVSVIMGVIVGLTFLFGFGNVLSLALRLGVSPWVAPLVAPAVDLSVLALLVSVRRLALRGATVEQLRPARRLLIFCSVVTLALNIADPLALGEWGKAAFDAVGPLLLIGWADVGPGLLQAIGGPGEVPQSGAASHGSPVAVRRQVDVGSCSAVEGGRRERPAVQGVLASAGHLHDDLLGCAREADAEHRAVHQRPISAESLRKLLHIGAHRSRALVAELRRDHANSERAESVRHSALMSEGRVSLTHLDDVVGLRVLSCG